MRYIKRQKVKAHFISSFHFIFRVSHFQIRKFSLLRFVLVEASPSPKSLIFFTSFLNSDQLEPQGKTHRLITLSLWYIYIYIKNFNLNPKSKSKIFIFFDMFFIAQSRLSPWSSSGKEVIFFPFFISLI